MIIVTESPERFESLRQFSVSRLATSPCRHPFSSAARFVKANDRVVIDLTYQLPPTKEMVKSVTEVLAAADQLGKKVAVIGLHVPFVFHIARPYRLNDMDQLDRIVSTFKTSRHHW